MIIHPIDPVFDSASRILILGSFPSVKSREQGFYYGHPQNRFWQVLPEICGCEPPVSIEEKKAFLLNNRIALWDVIKSCEIDGSADSTIRNVVPNDITVITDAAQISRIFTNGRKAAQLYNKYIGDDVGIEAVCLPSTSPANAAFSLERLCRIWHEEMKDFV